ncbi:DUF7312 domain-containing protein [Natrononativus amylolyticus]|uniref:DUF7312 domain-containing protein n=1 Tax=Natrononativus amylolyticus TaxID=2963434 RepID=UPI0020CCCBB3|nr:hypothetical protein [Natrononativus amylolyticus]
MAEDPSGDDPDATTEEGGFEFGTVDEKTSEEAWDRTPITPAASDERSDGRPAPEGADDAEDDPYGPEPRSTPVVAGEPSLENAVFVALGAVAMILVIVRVASIAFV